METTHSRPILFPYLTLNERDFRHLALLVPRTCLLQILDPPALPPWGGDQFSVLPLELKDQEREQIRQALGSYREYAAVHQDHCLAASFSSETLLRQSWESRFDIQSSVRRQDDEGADPETRKLYEAAVFLEMARELDQKQADLDFDLAEASHLETEFREILGIGDEDSSDDTLDTLTPPLAGTRAHLSFMLARRIASWLRLLCDKLSTGEAVTFVTVNREVVEELMERMAAHTPNRSRSSFVRHTPLVTIPSLPNLTPDAFAHVLGQLERTQRPQSFWKTLVALLAAPDDGRLQEAAQGAGDQLKQEMLRLFDLSMLQNPTLELSVTSFPDLFLSDLWQAFLPGSPVPEGWSSLPVPSVLCLQEPMVAILMFDQED